MSAFWEQKSYALPGESPLTTLGICGGEPVEPLGQPVSIRTKPKATGQRRANPVDKEWALRGVRVDIRRLKRKNRPKGGLLADRAE
jgi:hypothetical protein